MYYTSCFPKPHCVRGKRRGSEYQYKYISFSLPIHLIPLKLLPIISELSLESHHNGHAQTPFYFFPATASLPRVGSAAKFTNAKEQMLLPRAHALAPSYLLPPAFPDTKAISLWKSHRWGQLWCRNLMLCSSLACGESLSLFCISFLASV